MGSEDRRDYNKVEIREIARQERYDSLDREPLPRIQRETVKEIIEDFVQAIMVGINGELKEINAQLSSRKADAIKFENQMDNLEEIVNQFKGASKSTIVIFTLCATFSGALVAVFLKFFG